MPPWTESSHEAASWALALATQNNQKQAKTINGQPTAMAATSSSHSSDSFSISTVQQTMTTTANKYFKNVTINQQQ